MAEERICELEDKHEINKDLHASHQRRMKGFYKSVNSHGALKAPETTSSVLVRTPPWSQLCLQCHQKNIQTPRPPVSCCASPDELCLLLCYLCAQLLKLFPSVMKNAVWICFHHLPVSACSFLFRVTRTEERAAQPTTRSATSLRLFHRCPAGC